MDGPGRGSRYLNTMFQTCEKYQIAIHGVRPAELSDVDKMAYIREQALALIVEIAEALGETGWKSWASSNHINASAYRSELCADALRFFINLCLVANIRPSQLFETFMAKQVTLDKRLVQYDGVTGKCGTCRRDLNDPGVNCTPAACSWDSPAWSQAKPDWQKERPMPLGHRFVEGPFGSCSVITHDTGNELDDFEECGRSAQEHG